MNLRKAQKQGLKIQAGEARQSSRRLDTARPQRLTLPEVSQKSVGSHVNKEVPDIMASAARQTGLWVDSKERLNHPNSATAAIVEVVGVSFALCF